MSKTLVALLVFAFLFSCNSDGDSAPANSIDPTLLQKVIFYPNSSNPTVYNFYENGLLKEIVRGSNTKTFVYDGNNNLISLTSTGTQQFTNIYTYDTSNFLTSVNGQPMVYSYGVGGGKYTRTYEVPAGEDPNDYPSRSEYALNGDLLLTSHKMFYGLPESEYYMRPVIINYENGNIATIAFNDFDTEMNYEFNTSVNPLRQALLPAAKAMVLLDTEPATLGSGNFISINNVEHQFFAPEDPESYGFSYTYNSNNLPVIKTMQFYDFDNPLGAPEEFAHYYYQGDELP